MALKQSTVLLIDDDPVFRGFIAAWLAQCGYRLRAARDGREGLKEIQSERPDLVLCDLQMPGLDGLQVLRRLVLSDPGLPVVMISGASRIADVVDALRLGAWDYLLKPIARPELLHNSIEECLSRARDRQPAESGADSAKGTRTRKKGTKATKSKTGKAAAGGALCGDTVELHTNLLELSESPQFGRRVQRELLPVVQARFGPIHINRCWKPKQEISGDFLDFFPLDEHRIAFYLVDVSSHGPAAAFMMVLLKSLLNAPLRDYQRHQDSMLSQPEQVLSYLNNEICRINLGHALNISFGVLDLEAGQACHACGALDPPPLLWKPDDQQWQPLQRQGAPLGVSESERYQQFQHPFAAGSQLLLCSDGVFTHEQRPDPARLEQLLSRLGSSPLQEDIWQAQLFEPVAEAQDDDLCALLLEWPGEK